MFAQKAFRILVAAALMAALPVGCKKNPAEAKAQFVTSAEKYMATQEYSEAIIQYRNALKIEPSSSKLQFSLGEAYFKNSQYREAFAAYKKASELDPNNVGAQIALGKFYLVSQQFEEAIQTASGVLTKNPDQQDAAILLANAYAGKKDIPQAIKVLQDLISKHPDNVNAYMNLGVFLAAKGDLEGARQQFEKAATVDPKSVEAHKALATYYMRQKNFAKAEEQYKIAVSANPTSVPARQILAQFYTYQKRSSEAEPLYKEIVSLEKNSAQSRFALASFYITQSRIEDAKKIDNEIASDSPKFLPARFQLADMALQNHNLDEADKIVNAILKERSKEPQALILHGRILLERKDPQKAISELEAAQRLEPNVASLYYLLGIAYGQSGNLERAQSSFEQAIAKDQNFTQAYLALAEMMLNRGQNEACLRYVDQVLQKNSSQPEAILLQGSAFANMRDLPKAEAAFQKYQQLRPDSPQGALRSGLVAIAQKHYDVAEKNLEHALVMNPKQYDALDGLVTSYLVQKKNDKAIARIQEQIQKDQSPVLYALLGKTYAQLGQNDAAEKALKHAIEMQPGDFAPYVLLGDLYVKQKTLDKALAQFDAATKLNPKASGLWTMYGMLNEQTGHQEAAKTAYQKALEIAPNSGVAANNLAWLYADEGKDMDRALELARTAKIAMPQSAPISDTLGWIYYKRQLYSSAIPLLSEAVKQEPDHAVFHFHLAATLLEAGKKEQAKVELSKALKLDSNLKNRADVQKAMGTLAL